MKTQKHHPLTYMEYVSNPAFEVAREKGTNVRFRNKDTARLTPWVSNPAKKFSNASKRVTEEADRAAEKLTALGQAVKDGGPIFGSDVLTKHITRVTKDELFAALDHYGIEYDPKSKKADLRALLQDNLR